MKVGDLVNVKTRLDGIKLAIIIKELRMRDNMWLVNPINHPRNIYALECDLEVVNESR